MGNFRLYADLGIAAKIPAAEDSVLPYKTLDSIFFPAPS